MIVPTAIQQSSALSKSAKRRLRKEKHGPLTYKMSSTASVRHQQTLQIKSAQFTAVSLTYAEGAFVGVNQARKRINIARTKAGLLRRGYHEIAWDAKCVHSY